MEIKRVKGDNKEKISWKDGLFMNIYYFLSLYKMVALLILGVGLAALMIILALDYMAPKELGALDKKATLGLFDALQSSNRHQEAIMLMEYKMNSVLKDDPDELLYKTKLSDSYIHVGDYSKAEKMLLDVIKEYEDLQSSTNSDITQLSPSMYFYFKFSNARILYQLYEKIGDKNKQVQWFKVYKEYFDQLNADYDSLLVSSSDIIPWYNKPYPDFTLHTRELVEYDSIICLSFSDQLQAIERMERFIDKIINNRDFGAPYKIKCLNKLIRWQIDNGMLLKAYRNIKIAVELTNYLYNVEYQYFVLGELSDLCYEVHDIDMSRKLYLLYEKYLDEKYNKTDFEYLSNYARQFRYLEHDEEWDKLIEVLTLYCKGMRRQIAQNIPSMTEEQREFFAKQFDVAYDYAFDALKKHPCEELACLCFDNVTFKSGLLLRSNRQIENSIMLLGDKEIEQKYEELKKCRLELVCQKLAENSIFSNADKLQNKIDQLEKEIALKCTDFKTKNEIIENDYKSIAKKLSKDEALVNLIEHENDLFALVVKDKSIEYVKIGRFEQIEALLKRPVEYTYHNDSLTTFLWSRISDVIGEKDIVYYVPVGKFNQFALGTLYLGNGKYLTDMKDLRLISNPSDILNRQPLSLTAKTTNVSLWGGIDYGTGNTEEDKPMVRSAISRGQTLSNLKYAYQEVSDISSMLTDNHIKNDLYSSERATEESFKKRNGQKDYVLHISTHGFFNDKAGINNSMLESGLFFAGANAYWSNDSVSSNLNTEDGILRAAEISEMNLAGCSLVVLSACETGLGYSDTSEGIYGLQRAFKLAGAEYVLMSLWDVDDQATAMLMTELYKNILINQDIDIALQNSRKKVREFFPSPKDWGGFVLLH